MRPEQLKLLPRPKAPQRPKLLPLHQFVRLRIGAGMRPPRAMNASELY